MTGNYRPEHLFALQQAVELSDIYEAKKTACDQEIERHYAAMAPVVDLEQAPLAPAKTMRRPRRNELTFDARTYLYQIAGVDLTEIDGVDAVLAQKIVAEIGVDMSP